MHRTSNTDVERIELSSPGEWIEVKRKMGKDDERRRSAIMLRGQPVVDGEIQFDAGVLMEAAPFATLFVVAKKWNVVDPETGRVASLNEANMRALSDEDMAIIKAKFEELYAEPLTEDQAKN